MRGSVDVLYLVFNRTYVFCFSGCFCWGRTVGTATAVIEEASPLSATLHDFHRVSEMK